MCVFVDLLVRALALKYAHASQFDYVEPILRVYMGVKHGLQQSPESELLQLCDGFT
jgi:hypothetical protein